jgi:hypothetical protein
MRALLLLPLLLPLPCLAQVAITTSGAGQYQVNSNVFDLQPGFPLPGTEDYHHADQFYAYSGSFVMNDLWQQQKFFTTLTATEFEYDHFKQLDHTEYRFDGGWNWILGPALDGTLDVSRVRSMVAFTDVIQSEIAIQTEQRETAGIGFHFSPDWRVEGLAYRRDVDEPLPGEPNLQLSESFGQATLKYLGRAGVTSGLSASYLVGDFTGSVGAGNPAYRQDNIGLVANYQVNGVSSFVGDVGFSRRTSSNGTDNISGTTGELDYKNQITGKTAIELTLDRVINSYIVNTGSEFDSFATLKVNWQTTYKINVAAAYTWTLRDLPGQGDAPPGSNRVDHLQYSSLFIDYEALTWLSLRPYANIQSRRSNYIGANFDSTVYGVNVIVRWQNQTAAQVPAPGGNNR